MTNKDAQNSLNFGLVFYVFDTFLEMCIKIKWNFASKCQKPLAICAKVVYNNRVILHFTQLCNFLRRL